MSIPKIHSEETKKLLKAIPKSKIAKWLLEEGYYAEQYVLPPTFKVTKFPLNVTPFFGVQANGTSFKFEPTRDDLICLSFPKSQLTDRTFGIIEPKIYHDIVWHVMNNWDFIIEHLFNNKNTIYSYSFPIPVTKKNEGSLGSLRAGRMIYEFIEMAENDLVAEAHNYKYILKTDIKNFYPSIYTHSIAWALHTKNEIRKSGNRSNFPRYFGLILDKLFQSANDGCTNGIAIGSAISDLISEVILAAIDKECSEIIEDKKIEFLGVRFKDDYRFLCQSKEDANFIIKTLQSQLRAYNLSLNEDKSDIKELPEGLFRPWVGDYQPYSLRYKSKIHYKRFENSLLGALKVDGQYGGTGVVDRFLSELTTKKNYLKLKFNEKDTIKAISLLLLLKARRNKSFPQILAIIEEIINANKGNTKLIQHISSIIEGMFSERIKNESENQYDLIWLLYFIKSLDLFKVSLPKKINSLILKSIKNNTLEFFKPLLPGTKLFETLKKPGKNIRLIEHLEIFKK